MIKIRYVAQIEIEDEIEENDNTFTVDEIRQNAQNDMVKDACGRTMTELVKVILIALTCPFVLPLVIGEEEEQ